MFCKQGLIPIAKQSRILDRIGIAIECDNKKAHSSLRQREKDKIKNTFLRQAGWVVIRLSERDIVSDLKGCITKIKKQFGN